ncbi:MAG: hypothetical protein E7623_05070 [Ruminococcaceae bacterium]|nr:hypothetical protein [Oscillospiraceae bacterium]
MKKFMISLLTAALLIFSTACGRYSSHGIPVASTETDGIFEVEVTEVKKPCHSVYPETETYTENVQTEKPEKMAQESTEEIENESEEEIENESENEDEIDTIPEFETEDDVFSPKFQSFLIDAPHIYQFPKYPNGCEPVSTVMALRHIGVDISVDDFIEKYLDRGRSAIANATGPDPREVYSGDPRNSSGWGCHAPVIAKALDKFLDADKYGYDIYEGMGLEELCGRYIDKGIPVIIWATLYMHDSSAKGYIYRWETPEGKEISYNMYHHCVLLVGYDEEHYIVSDPYIEKGARTRFDKDKVNFSYELMGMQSLAIYKK